MPQPWQLSEKLVTPENAFYGRRRFLKSLIGAGIAGAALPLTACQRQAAIEGDPFAKTQLLNGIKNTQFEVSDRPITNRLLSTTYNNFYEYGNTKNIWGKAQALTTNPWSVEVTGLIKNPQVFDLDALMARFPIEERIYRFRCVEAWSMVVPWLGFPMNALLKEVDPLPEAKFVRFTSYFDPKVTPGPGFPPAKFLPFPYTEGLRIDEMANELAFFAVGLYGQSLPPQNGAPIRAVLPWKYGFKGAKSIVKIEFISSQPATFWNTLSPGEYKFESNVEPSVPHPRWSQARERLIGPGEEFKITDVPTLPYNGYGDYVAALYT